MRESPYLRRLAWQFLGMLTLCIVMGVTGPFGTYGTMGLGARLVYFAVVGSLTWVLITGLAAWSGQLEPINRWPIFVRMALAGLLAAIPRTATIIVVHGWLVLADPVARLPRDLFRRRPSWQWLSPSWSACSSSSACMPKPTPSAPELPKRRGRPA